MSRKIFDEFDGYKKGDWVAFQRDARVVIGQVEYVVEDFRHVSLVTTAGEVRKDSVLELRENKK